MKKLIVIMSLMLATVLASAQAPTNAPQFTVNINFLGGTPYGVNAAMDSAFTDQFTTNSQLRGDIFTMPSVGYTGYFGGYQYALAPLCPFLAVTSLNCGKFLAYVNGGIGLGRIQQNSLPSRESIAGIGRFGANYDPSGTGHFTLNLFEVGYGHFGPSVVGQSNNGWFAQTGFNIGLGTNAPATQAKLRRMQKSQQKKAKAASQKP